MAINFRTTTMSGLKDTDALIVPLFEDGLADIRGIARPVQSAYERIAGDDQVRLPYHRSVQVLERAPVGRLVVVNAGKRADFDVERARRVTTAGVRALWDFGVKSVAVAFDSGLDDRRAVRAGVEGVHFAMFRA